MGWLGWLGWLVGEERSRAHARVSQPRLDAQQQQQPTNNRERRDDERDIFIALSRNNEKSLLLLLVRLFDLFSLIRFVATSAAAASRSSSLDDRDRERERERAPPPLTDTLLCGSSIALTTKHGEAEAEGPVRCDRHQDRECARGAQGREHLSRVASRSHARLHRLGRAVRHGRCVPCQPRGPLAVLVQLLDAARAQDHEDLDQGHGAAAQDRRRVHGQRVCRLARWRCHRSCHLQALQLRHQDRSHGAAVLRLVGKVLGQAHAHGLRMQQMPPPTPPTRACSCSPCKSSTMQ